MKIELFKNVSKENSRFQVDEFIKEIIGRLKKMEEELVIDRFEGNIAICENRKTGEIKEILKEELEEELKEGNIIKYENGKYVLDKEKQEEIEKRIKEKMDDIWNK